MPPSSLPAINQTTICRAQKRTGNSEQNLSLLTLTLLNNTAEIFLEFLLI